MVILKDGAEIRDMDAIIKIRYAIDEKKSMPVDIVVSRHSAFGRRKETPCSLLQDWNSRPGLLWVSTHRPYRLSLS
ncbi:hypothetical protein AGMMS49944_00760 [Spirochaetia bacterium]|nr:hypothetical protein AGMMS49944_00760 [Spirochaetia bacterium]